MNQQSFKSISRRLVIELAVVVALVSYKVNFPKGTSITQAWRFVFTNALVLLHVVVGTIILAEAIIFLIRSIRSHNRSWISWAFFGLAFVLLAYVSGEFYVATQNNVAITYMGYGWFGAIVTFGLGWYWGPKKTTSSRLPSSEEQDKL
jgi:uncharacterized membrane protein YozB (DUF420 family)